MYYEQIVIILVVNILCALGAWISLSSGVLVLALGSAFSVGAISSAISHAEGVGFPVAILTGATLAALLMGIVYLLNARASGFVFAISTLAAAEALRVLITNIDMFGGALGFTRVRMMNSYSTALVFGCAVTIIAALFDRNGARDSLVAVAENPRLAVTCGINPYRVRAFACVTAGALCGMGGALSVHSTGILEPRSFGFEQGMQILVFGILGGPRWWGPVISAIVLTIVPEIAQFSHEVRMFSYCAILIFALILLPRGLSGGLLRSLPPSFARTFR